jgi:hypothetical protein
MSSFSFYSIVPYEDVDMLLSNHFVLKYMMYMTKKTNAFKLI